jgi:hypothetical protein
VRVHYDRDSSDPPLQLWWLGQDRQLIDFSAVAAWSLRIGIKGRAALVTKTTGITGAAGSGTEESGTPNVSIVFTASELDLLQPGTYDLQLKPDARVPLECKLVIDDTVR